MNLKEFSQKLVELIKEADAFVDMSGAQKKAYVLDKVVVLDDNVKMLKDIPNAIERIVLGYVIDVVVNLVKDRA